MTAYSLIARKNIIREWKGMAYAVPFFSERITL